MRLPDLPAPAAAVSARIRDLIARYVPALASHREPGLAAKRAGWLPVSFQLGGIFVLHPDGTVALLPFDPPYRVQPEDTPQWHLLARVHAARLYPELTDLLPVRTADAESCKGCGGAGQLQVGSAAVDCFVCVGLGWLEPD